MELRAGDPRSFWTSFMPVFFLELIIMPYTYVEALLHKVPYIESV
jgi:hypothetical protein